MATKIGLNQLKKEVTDKLDTVFTDEEIKAYIDNLIVSLVPKSNVYSSSPIGDIIAYLGTEAPLHYLVCDGTEYNIADYPDLAAHFIKEFGKYNYYGGDGITTFCVPDLRGEFLRGAGQNGHEGQGSGSAVGKHQDATVHNAVILGGSSNGYLIQTYQGSEYNLPKNVDSSKNGNQWSNNTSSSHNSGTNISTYTSRPTNTSVLYCVKYEEDLVAQITVNAS